MNNIYFHYYTSHVDSKKPLGLITPWDFIEVIRNPSEKIKKVFRLISIAARYHNETGKDHFLKRKDNLKQNNLFYFTPCVYTDGKGRGYINILKWNGLAVMDFDKIDNAEELKKFIFDNYKCVICAYLSPSKRGVKFLVKMPVVYSTDEFKEYFYGLGCEFQKVKGWDGTAQNCVLPLFISYDPNALYRDYEQAETWTDKGKVFNAFVEQSGPVVKVETDDEKKAIIYRNIREAFSKITSEGHPQVRAAGVSLGGYVASGYLTQFEAEQLIEECVRTTPYLQKGVTGYLTTAKSAVKKGLTSPIRLRENI